VGRIIRSNPLTFEGRPDKNRITAKVLALDPRSGKPKKMLEQNARCDAIEALQLMEMEGRRWRCLLSQDATERAPPGSLKARLNETTKEQTQTSVRHSDFVIRHSSFVIPSNMSLLRSLNSWSMTRL
jgi:hypothetical protein